MLTLRQLPQVNVRPHQVVLAGGLDTVSSPMMAKPGLAKAAMNYEASVLGGFERVGGFERFSGQPRPSDAVYEAIAPLTVFTDVLVGDTVTGQISGSTAIVCWVEPDGSYIAVTQVSAPFDLTETLLVGATPIGDRTASDVAVSPEQDNILLAAAADAYRADIGPVPGSGPIRGIAALNDDVFAWRDNAGATAMVRWKASPTGWLEVPLFYEVSFTGGTTQPAEGATLTQGGVTATVKRVVLQSGTWSGSAAGRYIVTQPQGGSFIAGALGSGAGTVPAAGAGVYHGTQITLSPGGRVETDTWNFSGSQDTLRLYGCDGVNREFEFDGTVLVPLKTGMPVFAKFVKAHKNFLFYAFKGSLQHAAVGSPYLYSAVFGAGEIGAGDEITGLVTTAGSEDSAALVVACKNSAHVLYGTGPSAGAGQWNMVTLSRTAGANAYSLQDAGLPMAHDPQGFRVFNPTQSFGNFRWDLVSNQVDPLARGRVPSCSVFSVTKSRYRCIFQDGSALSGTPLGKGQVAWSQINYGITFAVAYAGEVSGESRTFYGDPDSGYVYEADVGRSFDGVEIQSVLRLVSITVGSPMLLKQFRGANVEVVAESAITLYTSAEFNDGDIEREPSVTETIGMTGQGGQWDVTLWDQSRWDAAAEQRRRLQMVGQGYSISPIFFSQSKVELPHTIKSLMLLYSPRRLTRG